MPTTVHLADMNDYFAFISAPSMLPRGVFSPPQLTIPEHSSNNRGIIRPHEYSVALQVCLNLLFTAMGIDTYASILELLPLAQNDAATSISIATTIDEYLEDSNATILPGRVETVVLQNVLGWLHSEHLDLRCIAAKILLALARNPENRSIVDRQLVNLIDGDCVYIKNLILRRINKSEGVSDSVKEYIMNKCKADPNYVVRMVCLEEYVRSRDMNE